MSGDESLLAVLRAATVRINVCGVVSGTGFIVAPDQVVTCYHVIEPALVPVQRWSQIAIHWGQEAPVYATSISVLDVVQDLAWLHLDGPTQGPVVRLDESIEVDDALYTWGFPPERPEGIPATYESEGQQGGQTPWIKFKAGQVVKGMSGSPLLNRRVGAVCGVLKRTRDASQDLGGYGIPAIAVFRSFATLRQGNVEALSVDQRWRDAMTAAQREQAAPLLASAAQRSEDLVIDIGQGEENRWAVTGRILSDDVPWPTEPVDLNTVRAEVARLFRLLGARDRLGEIDRARLLGQVLARAVLPTNLAERFDALLRDEGLRINVSLHFRESADEDLVHLPWELLYLPGRKPNRTAIMLGASPRLTLSRVLVAEPEASWSDPTVDLTVTVIRAPDVPGSGKKPIRDLAADVLLALKEAIASEPAMLNDAPQSALEKHLANGETDVVHYVGFGRYREQRDEIAFSSDADELGAFLTAEEFADSLSQVRPPRLVVLQPCQGPNGQVPADLAAMAPQLLMRGVAAVVVLAQSLEDGDDIQQMLDLFYRSIASGKSLQRAVQDVRAQARFRRRAWLYPSLFIRQPVELTLTRERRRGGQW